MLNQELIDRRFFGISFGEQQQATVKLWYPHAREVAIVAEGQPAPIALSKERKGYWYVQTTDIKPGALYSILVDNERVYPDPASLVQPQGPLGPSQVVDVTAYEWEDACWINPPFNDYRMAELDMATFTTAGTFDAAIKPLCQLRKAGIRAVVVSPTWSAPNKATDQLDTTSLYAICPEYGTPRQFQHFIDRCHYEDIAVTIDLDFSVIYAKVAGKRAVEQYPSRRVGTDWLKRTLRLGRTRSKASMLYCLDNALMWFRDFHVDALRISGLHACPDADVLINQIREAANQLTTKTGRQYYLLIDCESTQHETEIEPTYRESFCLEGQVLTSNDTVQVKPYGVRKYRLDYLYDRRFASLLTELFGRWPR